MERICSLQTLRDDSPVALHPSLTISDSLVRYTLLIVSLDVVYSTTLEISKGTLVASITRNGETFTPGGKDFFQIGDTVIVVTINKGISRIEQILDDKTEI